MLALDTNVDALAAPDSDKEHLTALTVSLLESTWVVLLLLGVLASAVAWSVDWCVLLVQRLRTDFSDLGGAWLPDYLLYTAYRVFILVLGVACAFFVCPNAAGSGIPEMRSILGGFPFPNYLSKRTLLAKCVGLVFALGSGLSIGKEGPFVHLSCIIAHQLLNIPFFAQIRRSPDLTHHVLAAACAVGVTATFGAPIGGVLFSIEVTTTYYVTSNYWRAFFSSVYVSRWARAAMLLCGARANLSRLCGRWSLWSSSECSTVCSQATRRRSSRQTLRCCRTGRTRSRSFSFSQRSVAYSPRCS